MQRFLGVVLAVLALLVPFAGSSSAAVHPVARMVPSTYSHEAVHATNVARLDHGRKALSHSSCLQRKARAQAKRMARQKRMFHQALSPVLHQCGMNFVGENVAFGYPNGDKVVWKGWMKSPPHRRNLLNRKYHLIAVGSAKASNGSWYVSQVFGRHR